ncbi:RND family efflux system, outer membrane channel protein, TolC family [Aliarcobacter cibarius]|uniref:RND family efflux system, outer membrane channel protein, TolC family n=2 Tax=Aliarcobacter cibarius TaxID=255507 RepID=A0A7L5JR52_9BACT|nr:TolC family protein [Aliarcobacter cibarius]QKJ27540.1 RND family efflux system, outer membrane channel protein, TolC family [Aliarcobacter cibarius]TLT04431.1 TolC family protein [Aliarcobacter cibarius]
MKKILIYSIFCSFALANQNNLQLIQKDKKEYQELDMKSIQTKYENLKSSWIGTVGFSSSISRYHSFGEKTQSNIDRKFSKKAAISFKQSIFESGGIELQIEYAKDKFNYDMLAWENKNQQYLQNIYNILLEINKVNLQIDQAKYRGLNKEIEEIIKRIQYEAGKTDIIELNNAIMNKNLIKKEIISLENLLKEQEYELAKYTDLKYQEIEILDFSLILKDDFMSKNLNILQEQAKVSMLKTDYEKQKTDYLPKIYFSTGLDYSNSGDTFSTTLKDTNKDDAGGNVALGLEMPLYDYNKSTKLEEAKLEVLKQKAFVNDVKNEESNNFETLLTKIDTYKKHIKTIEDNIKLYDELIKANEISNQAGMTSMYDLDILRNTKEINLYDLKINDISILQQYVKLHFQTRN